MRSRFRRSRECHRCNVSVKDELEFSFRACWGPSPQRVSPVSMVCADRPAERLCEIKILAGDLYMASALQRSFSGFRPDALEFFRLLSANQNRDWFQEHKSEYETQVREPLQALVSDLSNEFRSRRIPLRGDPKHSLFRIYRDIRFSEDKSPYKTHASATLTREGGKMSPGGVLYIHIDPQGSFAAAGFYQPPTDALLAMRQRAAEYPAEVRRILKQLAGNDLSLGEGEGSLKRMPRGFEHVEAPELMDFVRRKSFVVHRSVSENLLQTTGLVDFLVEFTSAAMPLLGFGWKVLDARPIDPLAVSAT